MRMIRKASRVQIEKDGIGNNRISASRLYGIALKLALTFDMFFQAPALNARRAASRESFTFLAQGVSCPSPKRAALCPRGPWDTRVGATGKAFP